MDTLSRRRFAGPVLALLLLVSGPAVAAGAGPVEGIAVSGRVSTPAGAPLAGAAVELVPIPDAAERGRLMAAGAVTLPPVARGESDREGRFRLTAPGPGLWGLLVRAPGYLPMVHDLIPLVTTTALPPVTLLPDAGAAVRVVDPAGRPVTGARLRARNRRDPVWEAAREAGWSPVRTFVQTRQDGTAVVPRTAGETLVLSAWAPAWVETTVEIAPRAGRSDDDAAAVALRDGAERRVRVLTPGGRPVAGASVRVGGPRGLQAGLTDGDGRLRVRAVTDEPVELVVAADSGLRGRFRVTLHRLEGSGGDGEGEAAPPLELRLTPSVLLPGRVVDAGDGSPVAGAVVWSGFAPGEWVLTGDDGTFALPEPQGEGVALRVAAAGYQRPPLRGRATAGRGPWTVALTPVFTLAGRVVTEGGEPVAGAVVDIPRIHGPRHRGRLGAARGETHSAADGTFRIDDLPRGPVYELRVRAAGYGTVEQMVASDAGPAGSGIAVGGAGEEEVRVVLAPAGAVTGRVVRATGEPAEGARVEVYRDDDTGMAWWARREDSDAAATVSADGAFAVADLAAGLYVLRVDDPRAPPLHRHGLEVRPGQVTDVGGLELAPGVVLEGEVVDAAGGAVGGVRIQAVPLGGVQTRGERRRPYPEVETGEDGRFRLPGLPAGEPLHLVARAPDGPEVRVPRVVPPTGEPLRLVLPRSAELFGRVVDDGGEPVAEAWVIATVWSDGGGGGGGSTRQSVRTGEDGRFHLRGLNPGRLRLEAVAGGRSSREPPSRDGDAAPLQPGELRGPLEIVLPGGTTLAGRVLRSDGTPAVGARVLVRTATRERLGREGTRQRSTTTDGAGVFRLDGVPAAPVEVEADLGRAGRATWEGAVEPAAGEDGEVWIELRAEPQLYVAGRVSGDDGRPLLASIRVVAVEGSTPGEPPPRLDAAGDVVYVPGDRPPITRHTRSAADGTFFLGGLPAARYRLMAWAPGHVRHAPGELIDVVTEPVDGVQIRLSGGIVVHGELLGVEPGEVGEVEVAASGGGGAAGSQQAARVTADGRYRVEGLSPGEWRLHARMPRTGRRTTRTVELRPGDEVVEVDLDLHRGLVVDGEVRLDGAVPHDAALLLRRVRDGDEGEAGGRRPVTVPVLADGRFRAEGLEAGSYLLSLQGGPLGNGPSFQRRVEVASDRALYLDFPCAAVTGRVVDTAGQPVPFARILLRPLEGLPPGQDGGVTRSDADGTYAFHHVPPGRWRVEAERQVSAATAGAAGTAGASGTAELTGTAEVVAVAGTAVVDVTVR